MTITHSIASTVLVAIDISKHRHEVLIGVPGKKRRRRMTIMNTLEDFQRLSEGLVSYDLPVRIGFEATLKVTNNDGADPITNFSAALTFRDPETGEYTMEKAPCYHLVSEEEEEKAA